MKKEAEKKKWKQTKHWNWKWENRCRQLGKHCNNFRISQVILCRFGIFIFYKIMVYCLYVGILYVGQVCCLSFSISPIYTSLIFREYLCILLFIRSYTIHPWLCIPSAEYFLMFHFDKQKHNIQQPEKFLQIQPIQRYNHISVCIVYIEYTLYTMCSIHIHIQHLSINISRFSFHISHILCMCKTFK